MNLSFNYLVLNLMYHFGTFDFSTPTVKCDTRQKLYYAIYWASADHPSWITPILLYISVMAGTEMTTLVLFNRLLF